MFLKQANWNATTIVRQESIIPVGRLAFLLKARGVRPITPLNVLRCSYYSCHSRHNFQSPFLYATLQVIHTTNLIAGHHSNVLNASTHTQRPPDFPYKTDYDMQALGT